MRSSLINTCDQEADTVRALAVMLCVCLSAVGDRCDCGLDWKGAPVCEAGAEGLGLEEVRQDPAVGCEAGEAEAEVGVDCEDFLLIGGELFGGALKSNELA